MKTLLLFFVPLMATLVSLHAQDASEQMVRASWKAAKAAAYSQTSDPAAVTEAANAMRNVLSRQAASPEDGRSLMASELLDFTLALFKAKAGDYGGAYQSLLAEIAAQKNAQRTLLANTRNPAAFARDVFALHSEIMAHTGNITTLPDSGYNVFDVSPKGGPPSFAFVYEPLGSDEGGVAIEGVAESEQRLMIELSTPNETGLYKITDRAQVIGKRDGVSILAQSPDGKPKLRLSGVSKLIEYKGDFGVPIVHHSPASIFELAIDRGSIVQPIDAVKGNKLDTVSEAESAKNNQLPLKKANLPTSVQPAAPKKVPEAKPAPTPSQEPTSSTPWSVVVILMAAAIGLAGLLLNKRK